MMADLVTVAASAIAERNPVDDWPASNLIGLVSENRR